MDNFWSNFVSNGLATVLGVVLGIPAAFWLERRGRRTRDDEERKRLAGDRHALAVALITALDTNIQVLATNAAEISAGRMVVVSGVELFTWEALQARAVELLKDPQLIGRLAEFFAEAKTFDTMVAVYRDMPLGPPRQDLKILVIQTAPTIEQKGIKVRDQLKSQYW